MKVYLVGGAIRDKLLSIKVKERDWVVVGSSQEEMLKLGYKKVGKNFPVFIHPETSEEYALARKEIKTGKGHTGFNCFCSSNITLEEDLYRRDLTINAIAEDNNGNLIDPYFGIDDIKNRVIRHISINFKDDPLRILRIARFYAYLFHLKFKIANETVKLVKLMINNGELNFLSNDRIWKEIKKSMLTKNPIYFFIILNKFKSLEYIFPEIFILLEISNYNDKNKILNKILFSIKKIDKLILDEILRFSYFIYMIIKNFYLKKINNYKNEYLKDLFLRKKNILIKMSNRLNISNFFKKKVPIIIENMYLIENIENLNVKELIYLFDKLKLFKNKDNLELFINITSISVEKKFLFIDKKSNLLNKVNFINKIFNIINSININKFLFKNKNNIKEKIFKIKVIELKKWISSLKKI